MNPAQLASGMQKMHFHFSASQIIAGIIFGIIGTYVLRAGKNNTNFAHLFIGMGLIAYPYFVSNTLATWGIGAGLTALAWHYR